MTESNKTDRLPCGHPRGCLAQDAEGTAHCACSLKATWCEEVARLCEELERLRGDDSHPHESGDECMACKRLATERGWPYCNQCLLEHQLQHCNEVATEAMENEVSLREELSLAVAREAALVEAANAVVVGRGLYLEPRGNHGTDPFVEQDGAAFLPCQHCGKDVATPTLESVELCFECWERLRELIPDAGMLHRLTYAAEQFWEGGGGQAQRDIAAGYVLVEKLHEEQGRKRGRH